MEMVQLGGTEVNYIRRCQGLQEGQWLNLFIANIKITNGSLDIVSITDVLGEYQDAGMGIITDGGRGEE